MHKFLAAGAAMLALAAGASGAQAAVFVFAGTTTSYAQNFDTLAATGTGTFANLPAGVLALETGANADGSYAAGTGSSNTGNTFSFGTGSDRALGGLRSGNLVPLFGFGFTNDTGRTIETLDIRFTGEQWRLGTLNRADRLDAQVALSNDGTLTGGTFQDIDALDFASPTTTGTIGNKNGNDDAFRTGRSVVLTGLSIASGQSFALRFVDFDATGADDGLAIDDFAMTIGFAQTAVPEPASWAMMIGGFAMMGAASRRRRGQRVLA